MIGECKKKDAPDRSRARHNEKDIQSGELIPHGVSYFLMGATGAGSGVVGTTCCCCCCWQDTRAAAVRARIAMVFITFLSVVNLCSVPVNQG